jgi:N-ethylmaleimide reductase
LIESDATDLMTDSTEGQRYESVAEQFRDDLRRHFSGAIILAYRYDLERAEKVVVEGHADLVAFGRPFIANPDLVERLQQGIELAESDLTTWYGGGEAGYIDYSRATTPATS